MKTTTGIAALSAALLLSTAPFLVSADDDYWEERYESRQDGKPMNADQNLMREQEFDRYSGRD